MTTKAALLKQANDAHAQYPQYRNYWDKWVVGTITKDIKIKGTLVLAKGQQVLVDPATLNDAIEYGPKTGKISPTVYAANHYAGGCDLALGGPFVKVN